MKRHVTFERFSRARLNRVGRELSRALQRFATREDDPEAVHRLRVALRCCRSDLRLFRDYWQPKHNRLDAQMAHLTRRLGSIRDEEVILGFLAGQGVSKKSENGRLADPLRARWRRACRLLRRSARGSLGRQLPARMGQAAEELPLDASHASLRRARRRLVAKAFKRVRKEWNHRPDEWRDSILHRLRRALRRLRYTAEFFDAGPGSEIHDIIRQSKRWQQLLGKHQDAVTVLHWLAHTHDGAELKAAAQEQKKDTLWKFRKKWPKKGFRRLRRLIDAL